MLMPCQGGRPSRRRHGECPSCGNTEALFSSTLSNRGSIQKPKVVELADIPQSVSEVARAQQEDTDIG